MHRGAMTERSHSSSDAAEASLASSSSPPAAAAPSAAAVAAVAVASSYARVDCSSDTSSSLESLASPGSLSLCSSSSNSSLSSPTRCRSNDELVPYKEAEPLCGSVPEYERHVFVCYRETPSLEKLDRCAWSQMPKALGSAVKKGGDQLKKKVMVTVCQGDSDSELFDGTVMVFPEMREYRSLTRFDVPLFVKEALVEERNFKLKPKKLAGTHVFICCDPTLGSPCAAEGPHLYKRFKDEIVRQYLTDRVKVWKTASFSNHKEPGNVIIFRHRGDGSVDGDWYGTVKPADVSKVVEDHIQRGNIIEHLWRGRMGMDEEQQKEEREQRLRCRHDIENIEKCRPDSGMALIAGLPMKSVAMIECLDRCGDSRYADGPDTDDSRCLSESSSCSGREEEELSMKLWAKSQAREKVLHCPAGLHQHRSSFLIDGRVVKVEDSLLKRISGQVVTCGGVGRAMPGCRSTSYNGRSGSRGGGGRSKSSSKCCLSSKTSGSSCNSSGAHVAMEESVRRKDSLTNTCGGRSLCSFLNSNRRLEWESLDTIGVTSLAIAVFSTAVAWHAAGSTSSSSCCSQ